MSLADLLGVQAAATDSENADEEYAGKSIASMLGKTKVAPLLHSQFVHTHNQDTRVLCHAGTACCAVDVDDAHNTQDNLQHKHVAPTAGGTTVLSDTRCQF